jgi:hypothetical protein
MPNRIQRSRTKGWRMPDGAIYVGRPTRWGNPFSAIPHHAIGPTWSAATAAVLQASVRRNRDDEVGYISSSRTDLRGDVVHLFRILCEVRARDLPKQEMDAWLHPLRGRDLACWCPLDQPCHADVLLELANREVNHG